MLKKQTRVWGGSHWTEKAVFSGGLNLKVIVETGLASRDQNWGGRKRNRT